MTCNLTSFSTVFRPHQYDVRLIMKGCEQWEPGPEVIKLFSCSIQLSMKFFLLINVKMPTTVGILTFMSGRNIILCLSEPKKGQISGFFYTYVHFKFHPQLS